MLRALAQKTWRIVMIDNMTVGMENLPNVFINKIVVRPTFRNIKYNNIKVSLCMYDNKLEKSWVGRNLGIKIKIVFETEELQIASLNNGEISLHDITGDNVVVVDSNAFSAVGLDGEYEKYICNIEKELQQTPSLNVYAACFIEDIGFGSHLVFSKYYGPMVGEKVFEGGSINELSNYFYYPDTNEEYGGPVHQKPDGSYMEGSAHSEEPHKILRLVTEENYKILTSQIDSGIGLGLAPDNTGDIGSFVDFLVTDRQAGRPGLIDREYVPPPRATMIPTGIDDASTRVQAPDFNLAPTSTTPTRPPGY